MGRLSANDFEADAREAVFEMELPNVTSLMFGRLGQCKPRYFEVLPAYTDTLPRSFGQLASKRG